MELQNPVAGESQSIISRNFLIATIATLFAGSCGEILTPTIPQFALSLGVDVSLSGLAVTVYGVVSMAFRPVAGQMLDKIGRKKVVLMGNLAYIGTLILYLGVTTFPQLLALRVLQALSMCTVTTALSTIVTDVVPKDKLTEGLALSNVAGAICMSVGPALALWVNERYRMRGVFLLGLLVLVISFLLLLPMRYEEAVRPVAVGPKVKEKFSLSSLVEKSALLPTLMLMTLVLGQSSVYTFLPQYGDAVGVPDVGSFFLVTAVGIIFVRLKIGKIMRIFTEQAIFLFGTLTFFVCIGIFAFALTPLTLLLSGLLFGFGYGAIVAVLNGMALRDCPANRRGSANATYFMAFDLGFAGGSFFWGLVIQFTGYPTAFLLSSILTLVTLPIYFLIYRPRRLNPELL